MPISKPVELFEKGSLLQKKSTASGPGKPPSVLVVDDDVEICQILRLMLSHEHYTVQISQSVADAVKAIEEKSFDVYVVDYNLTDGSGLDVAELVRAKGSEAPIILVSGSESSDSSLRAERLHVSERIEKPFSRAMICDAVKKAIGSPKVALPDKSRVQIRSTLPCSPLVAGLPRS